MVCGLVTNKDEERKAKGEMSVDLSAPMNFY